MNAYVIIINADLPNIIAHTITLALSIADTKTKYDIVCGISDNLNQDYLIKKYDLNKYFNKIHTLPSQTQPINTALHILNFPYKKILYLTHKQLVMPHHNIDNIFDLSAPAGVFNNTNSNYYIKDGYYDYYRSKYDDEYKLYFKNLSHSQAISNQDIKHSLHNSFLMCPGTVLLEPFPDKKQFNKFIKIVSESKYVSDNNSSKYIKSNLFCILLAEYYLKTQQNWTNINRSYYYTAFTDQNSTIFPDANTKPKILVYSDIYPSENIKYKLIPEYKLWWDVYERTHSNILDKVQTNPNPVHSSDQPHKPYAITTLLMLGDSYLGGCLTFAKSYQIAHQNTDTSHIDLICMVTHDVSEYARFLLSLFFDRVIQVDYIEKKVIPMKTRKQEKMYSKWSDKSFTKWQCLKFVEYKKIFFLDADTLVLERITDVFNIRTPAGNFDMPWSDKYIKNFFIKDPYKDIYNLDNEPIDRQIIQKALDNTFVVAGTSVLLKPSLKSYRDYINLLDSYESYGHKGCYSMFDEQSLTELYLKKKKKWHYINRSYNFIPWKTSMSANFSMKIIHYFNVKPWHMTVEELYKYPDNGVYIYFAQKVWSEYIFCMNLFKDFRKFNTSRQILFNGLIVLSQKSE
jgi:alpha-N-acetylglucosamine transferase